MKAHCPKCKSTTDFVTNNLEHVPPCGLCGVRFVKTPRTLKQLAQEAIDVQDACNPLGVSKGFARALQDLRERLTMDGLPDDTPTITYHCVHQLWASKIHDLARMGLSDFNQFNDAYDKCKALAES